MTERKHYSKYDERKIFCSWCAYDGMFPMVEYRDGEYHASRLVLCRCTNGAIELEKSPTLLHIAIEFHKAQEMADGVNFVMCQRNEEFPKTTDGIPF